MNIKYMEKIMEKGYDLNIIALLYMFKGGEETGTGNEKIQAIISLMERKGLILEGRITASGEELLKFAEGDSKLVKEKEKIMDLEGIYDRMMQRVEELTGKKQVRTEIFGKTYSYFPSKYDFVTRLKKVVNKYGLTNMTILESTIMANVEKCHKTKKWYPLLVYYMTKDDVSPLAADYANWDDSKKEEEYDGTNI